MVDDPDVLSGIAVFKRMAVPSKGRHNVNTLTETLDAVPITILPLKAQKPPKRRFLCTQGVDSLSISWFIELFQLEQEGNEKMITAKLILLVDDDEATLRVNERYLAMLLQRMSREEGRSIDVAIHKHASPLEALDLMQASLDAERVGCRFDYFLMSDGNMPDINGDEFIRRARSLLGERLKRAFLITGNPRQFSAGAESIGYTLLGKPTEMFALVDDLRTFLFSADAPP